MTERPVLLYDGGCRPCRFAARIAPGSAGSCLTDPRRGVPRSFTTP